MKSAVVVLGTAAVLSGLLAVQAASQERIDTRSLTCSQAKALVKQNGALNLSTGRNIFERVVESRKFCSVGERAEAYRTATSDTRLCKVGRVCRLVSGKSGR